MASKKGTSKLPLYQVKVVLLGCEPPIWRRIQLSSETRLSELHHILQVVMGWEDCHLHQFIIGKRYYGDPSFSEFSDIKDEEKVKLAQGVTRPNQTFVDEYDFGDSWEHGIKLEKILPAQDGAVVPVCLAGERAGPPEDCGGVWGYSELLEAIRQPENPEYEEMREWLEEMEGFDPEAFALDSVSRELQVLWR